MMASDRVETGTIRTSDGLRLTYEVHGSGNTSLLVPLACWLLPDLASLLPDIRIVAYDPRGRGRSDPATADMPIGIDADLADLERLRSELGLARVALLGWSYFGGLAARYALAHPDRVGALVLVGPLPIRRVPHFGQGAQRVADRIDAEAMASLGRDARAGAHTSEPEKFCRGWYRALAPAYTASPDALDRMRADPCRWPNEHPAAVNTLLGRIWRTMGDWDWRDEFRRLATPTLVLYGGDDFQPRATADEWGRLAGARLVTLSHAGHMAWLDQPDAFAEAIRSFLSDAG